MRLSSPARLTGARAPRLFAVAPPGVPAATDTLPAEATIDRLEREFAEATKDMKFTFNACLEDIIMHGELAPTDQRVLAWIKRRSLGNCRLFCVLADGVTPARQRDCCAELGLDRPRVSRAVSNLEKRGYIRYEGRVLFPVLVIVPVSPPALTGPETNSVRCGAELEAKKRSNPVRPAPPHRVAVAPPAVPAAPDPPLAEASIDHAPHTGAAGLLSACQLFLERGKIERAQLAPRTETGYANDWRVFSGWTKARDLASLPASVETVTLFATDFLARGRKTTTVRRLISGVNYMHRRGGHPVEWNEQIDDLIAGARRLRPHGIEQAKPLKIEDLRAISVRLEADGSPRAMRNRALLIVGFCAALRSASLSELQLGDVEFEPRGAVLKLRREKNDQLGYGREIGLAFGKRPETCPVRALQSWIEIRTSFPGPLFTHIRQGHGSEIPLDNEAISTLLQSALKRIGVDPAGYSSHSMRSGMVTAAGENNISELIIARTTGHRDLKMVRRYFRRRDAFHTSLSSQLDL